MQEKRGAGEGKNRVNACIFLFFLFSFLGWCAEKCVFYLLFQSDEDRGFLRLPFCPIYGGSLLLIRIVLGLPYRENARYPYSLFRVLFYAVGAGAIATLAELFVGTLSEKYLGRRLWTYRRFPHAFGDYICLPMSVGWGFFITLAMSFLWTPLEKWVKARSRTLLVLINLTLSILLLGDFIWIILAGGG